MIAIKEKAYIETWNIYLLADRKLDQWRHNMPESTASLTTSEGRKAIHPLALIRIPYTSIPGRKQQMNNIPPHMEIPEVIVIRKCAREEGNGDSTNPSKTNSSVASRSS